MTRGIGGANRPPQQPAKLMSDALNAGSSAKPEAKAKAAPKALHVPGKGKEPVKVTPEDLAAVAKKEKKWEEKRLAEAIKESVKTYDKELANRAAGLGTSGVAHEISTLSPTPKALSRSNSDLHSTSGSSTAYYTAASEFSTSSHGSEPSTPRSSRLTRSMSEASKFSLNSQDIRNFQEYIHKAGKLPGTWITQTTRPVVYKGRLGDEKIVVDIKHAGLEPAKPLEPFRRGIPKTPLNTDVRLPDIGSGPSTPATKPHAGQDGRVTFPDSPSSNSLNSSSNSLTSADLELPDTQHAQPRPPERKSPLGKFTRTQEIGMAAAGAIGTVGVILAWTAGSDGDSSNDIST